MNILVTGGAGFIGSHLVERLLRAGQAVICFDNFSSGRKEFIEPHWGHPNFQCIEADLLDFDKLNSIMQGIDLVFHLAANPDIRSGIVQTDIDLKQGTLVTYNILESMRLNQVKKIAFSSSSVIYGEPKRIPTPENYGPLYPISLYGASKLACEGLISAFCHTFNMQGWIYRFANIVGKRSTHGILYDFRKKLKNNPYELEVLGNGQQKKSYLLVEDCVDAMLYVQSHAQEWINVYNLGGSDQISVSRIAELFLSEQNIDNVKIRYTGTERGWPGDVINMLLDISRLTQLGWKAQYTSEEIIKKAIKDLG